ncbi:MAG: ATP-binding cassette domain-containing protein [Clostridia bacterium]
MNDNVILKVDNLNTEFILDNNKRLQIIKNVSFNVYKGKMLAIVGESGCGKSVTACSIVRLLGKNGHTYDSSITFMPSNGKTYHLDALAPYGKEIRSLRGKYIGMIFQDSSLSLNPVQTVGKQVMENLMEHEIIFFYDFLEDLLFEKCLNLQYHID